jgi:hypothetical protein
VDEIDLTEPALTADRELAVRLSLPERPLEDWLPQLWGIESTSKD